jgi:platelet-activating factor acetylhydrolase IB subunit beta/gamma
VPTVVFAQTCDEVDKLVTTTPAPPPDVDRWRLDVDEFESIVRTHVDLVLLGDSLAAGWDPKMWLPKSVVNLGIRGDRTQHVLWRLSVKNWSSLRPRNVLIMLGTNNLSAGDKPCAIISGLIKVLERVRAIWPSTKMWFLGIPPRGRDFLFQNDRRRQVNDAISIVSGVKTIIVDEVISCGWREPCANYSDDNLHFTDAGYRVLLRQVVGTLFGR